MDHSPSASAPTTDAADPSATNDTATEVPKTEPQSENTAPASEQNAETTTAGDATNAQAAVDLKSQVEKKEVSSLLLARRF